MLNYFREGEVQSKDRVLVGTADGRIGLLILQSNKTLRITWLLTSTGSGITSLDTYELQDGIDILVGRQDGVIEVYTFPEEDVPSTLRYHYVGDGEYKVLVEFNQINPKLVIITECRRKYQHSRGRNNWCRQLS